MKRRTPTDNSKALPHAARRRPGTIFVSSGHLIFSTSGGVVCLKPPTRAETDAMIRDDIIEYYGATAKSSNVAVGGIFDQRAIADTAKEFGRTDWGIRDLLRKAGHGRGKVTRSSYE
jgi:hypothetical protein